MKKYFGLILATTAVLPFVACTPLAIGTGIGVVAGTAAVQEGGVSRALSDARIQTEINDRWFRHNITMFRKLDLTINQGRVLITGVVQDPQHRVEAVRLAWQPVGVVQVINEVKVAESAGIVGFAKDSWISARLRSALILDRDVESINYSIDTVQGTVYLMGFAQDQGELNHVMGIARTIPNVKQVVSYVKLAGTPEVKNPSSDYQQRFDDWSAPTDTAPTPGQATAEPIQWDQDSVYN